jgi:DNA-binding response OmpR family regulator
VLTYGDVELLPDRRHVRVSDKPYKLGTRAFQVLEVLASANGELVSKDEIMDRVRPHTGRPRRCPAAGRRLRYRGSIGRPIGGTTRVRLPH